MNNQQQIATSGFDPALLRSCLEADGNTPGRLTTKHDLPFLEKFPDSRVVSGVEIIDRSQYRELVSEVKSANVDHRHLPILQQVAPLIYTRPLAEVGQGFDRALNRLYEKFPNFTELLDGVRAQLKLQALGDRQLQFENILLVGPPGTGKTLFSESLAKALHSEVARIRISLHSEAFAISGLDRGYTNSAPGEVIQALLKVESANPILLLDEIDKVRVPESRPSLFNPLLDLLERNSAKRFTDVALGIEADCSRINWVATANDLQTIPEPILSRFHIYTIREPNRDQIQSIAEKIWSDLLEQVSWGKRFSRSLSTECLNRVVEMSPRHISRSLRLAAGRAADRWHQGPIVLQPQDIVVAGHSVRRIGFV